MKHLFFFLITLTGCSSISGIPERSVSSDNGTDGIVVDGTDSDIDGVVERYKKYKNISVFICGTKANAKRARDFFQSIVDVARNERAESLAFPENTDCGSATVTLEVIGYADESLNGEGLDEKGNIVKDRVLIVNISEPSTLNGVFIMVPISTTIKGIDPPEKRE